jgi:4-diphosphocytidyl-2-C-methyl-D-erythritol kinase
MVVFPHCKINLGLRVTAKRPDGYHNLETCFFPVPLTDALEGIPTASFSFTTSGTAVPGEAHDNLCVKAYHLLARDYNVPPVALHLHKVIPTGAGLAGGSADGAFTLRLLNTVFKLKLADSTLMRYAAMLGSDCSFFIQDKPMFGTGRGELLEPIAVNLSGWFLVLVKPAIHVSTREAYRGVQTHQPEESLHTLLKQPVNTWRENVRNDFEVSVFVRFPVLAEVKKMLYDQGAVYASMSGSGATVFGLFENEVDLQEKFKPYWYFSSVL